MTLDELEFRIRSPQGAASNFVDPGLANYVTPPTLGRGPTIGGAVGRAADAKTFRQPAIALPRGTTTVGTVADASKAVGFGGFGERIGHIANVSGSTAGMLADLSAARAEALGDIQARLTAINQQLATGRNSEKEVGVLTRERLKLREQESLVITRSAQQQRAIERRNTIGVAAGVVGAAYLAAPSVGAAGRGLSSLANDIEGGASLDMKRVNDTVNGIRRGLPLLGDLAKSADDFNAGVLDMARAVFDRVKTTDGELGTIARGADIALETSGLRDRAERFVAGFVPGFQTTREKRTAAAEQRKATGQEVSRASGNLVADLGVEAMRAQRQAELADLTGYAAERKKLDNDLADAQAATGKKRRDALEFFARAEKQNGADSKQIARDRAAALAAIDSQDVAARRVHAAAVADIGKREIAEQRARAKEAADIQRGMRDFAADVRGDIMRANGQGVQADIDAANKQAADARQRVIDDTNAAMKADPARRDQIAITGESALSAVEAQRQQRIKQIREDAGLRAQDRELGIVRTIGDLEERRLRMRAELGDKAAEQALTEKGIRDTYAAIRTEIERTLATDKELTAEQRRRLQDQLGGLDVQRDQEIAAQREKRTREQIAELANRRTEADTSSFAYAGAIAERNAAVQDIAKRERRFQFEPMTPARDAVPPERITRELPGSSSLVEGKLVPAIAKQTAATEKSATNSDQLVELTRQLVAALNGSSWDVPAADKTR